MEEIPPQQAAESPRVQFHSLENQSEYLSAEPPFTQDTDMEQGLTVGKAETTLPARKVGIVRGAPGLAMRKARNSEKKMAAPRGRTGREGQSG